MVVRPLIEVERNLFLGFFLLILRQTGVIEDARYKRKEALADLANVVTKRSG